MKRLLAAVTALMLVPSGVLASSIRPGSNNTIKSSAPRSPRCMDEEEKFKCIFDAYDFDESSTLYPFRMSSL